VQQTWYAGAEIAKDPSGKDFLDFSDDGEYKA